MFGRRRRDEESPEALHQAYCTARDADDAGAAEAYLRRLLEIAPDTAWAWFDAGLQSKRRRDWVRCADDNARALALADGSPGNPAAWNLGIALTALGRWKDATEAWRAYGIDVDALSTSSDPLVMRLAETPVRLNPEPRHLGETSLLLDGRVHTPEVVWCLRLCPARARIVNVPTPESGHRFGDVVLHDGEPVGERVIQGNRFPVFNELLLLERSPLPTLLVVVSAAPEDVEALLDAFRREGLGAEDHSTLTFYCRACSEGSPEEPHDHAGSPDGASRHIALGAPPERAQQLLRSWAGERPGRAFSDLDRAL